MHPEDSSRFNPMNTMPAVATDSTNLGSRSRSKNYPTESFKSKINGDYIGGSKALDSLICMIVSTENLFHPVYSGNWTESVSHVTEYLTSSKRLILSPAK